MVWKAILRITVSAALLLLPSLAADAALSPFQICQKRKVVALNRYDRCAARKLLLHQPGNVLASCNVQLQAALANAGTCRYVDNGDGTLTDLDLGIMWEKKTATNVTDQYDWATAASSYLSTLNGSTFLGGFAGYNDWRLPSVGELLGTLASDCPDSGTPCISDVALYPTYEGAYWTIETAQTPSTEAFVIDYGLGLAHGQAPKTEVHSVRAVRSIYGRRVAPIVP